MSSFIFRTDASSIIGTGHVMRCLALAQEMRIAGHNITFVMVPGSPLEDRLQSEGIRIHAMNAKPGSAQDVQETLQEAAKCDAKWIIVDGYQFDATYQQKLKDGKAKVLFIDDYGHCDSYSADLILNQNTYATEDMYSNIGAETVLLLGVQYALLRQEFLSGSIRRSIPEIASNILVTLGGGDPENVTGEVIEALRTLKDAKVKIVVGGANPNLENISNSCKELSMEMIVDTHGMKELMEWADVAISAGGSTCYELAYMGLPALTIVLADNQRPLAEGLYKAGVLQNLGWHADVSPKKISDVTQKLKMDSKKRQAMSKAGMELIDGKGAQRVLNQLL